MLPVNSTLRFLPRVVTSSTQPIASTHIVWNKETGRRIPINLNSGDFSGIKDPYNKDIYSLIQAKPILLEKISKAEAHYTQTLPGNEQDKKLEHLRLLEVNPNNRPSEQDKKTFLKSSFFESARQYLGYVTAPLQGFSNFVERTIIDPAIPYVEKFKTFWTIGLQEFFSFAVLSTGLTALTSHLTKKVGPDDPTTWYQYLMIGAMSLVIGPLVTQGIQDGFSDGENWQQYFIKKEGGLVKDSKGHLIPNLQKWSSRGRIIRDAMLKGGLVRTAKVAAVLLPQEIPIIKNIPSSMVPKTRGEWLGFGTELTTDIIIYLAIFGIDAINDGASGASTDWGMAMAVSTISVLAYCFTAPEIGRKFDKYKATWIRQVFSMIKTPVVMLAGAGILSNPASIGLVSTFSFGLWAWAKYGFKGDPKITQYTGKSQPPKKPLVPFVQRAA